jgi:hypothetical protein
MKNNPERREARQDRRELRQQSQLRGMSIEDFKEQRDGFREEFQALQEEKLNDPLRVELNEDSNLNTTIRAWEGQYPSLLDMIDAVYGDREQSRVVLKQIIQATGDDRLAMTPGAILKIEGNQVSLVGVHSNSHGVPVERISGRTRTTPKEVTPNTRPTQEPLHVQMYGSETRIGGVLPPYDPASDGFRLANGVWTADDGPQVEGGEHHRMSLAKNYSPEDDGLVQNKAGVWVHLNEESD